VAQYCIRRGLIRNEAVVKLRKSLAYILAHRAFHLGGSHVEVTRLLDQALEERGGDE